MGTNHPRLFLLSGLAIAAFAAAMTVKVREANAVVYCVEGVYRAGCVARPTVHGVARRTARRTARRVGRRSDMMLKHDILLLGRLDNGLGFYRFRYNGGGEAYVGVMAQEVQTVLPAAVVRGGDGYLRVFYDQVGVRFQSYRRWVGAGARVPAGTPIEP